MRDDDLQILEEITLDELQIALDLHTRKRVKVNPFTAFSWSISRHNTFKYCKRQYYLQYYGARRVRQGNEVVSAVWWLKQVTGLRAWIGTVIHRAAQQAVRGIKNDAPLKDQQIVDFAVSYYRDGMQASERGIKHDSGWVILFEHIYPETYSIDRDEAETLVHDLAQTFADSEGYAYLKSLPLSAIREVDESFQSFTMSDVSGLGKVKVFAIPDVLVNDGETITIIDWKTGDASRESIQYQAGVYRLYAVQRYGHDPEAVEVLIGDLGNQGESIPPPGGTLPLEETDRFIRESMQTMINSMEDPVYNTVAIKSFPMTDEFSRCEWCSYKRACWRHEVAYD